MRQLEKKGLVFMSISVQAKNIIAQGALTNSKHPDRFSCVVPTHVESGYKEYLLEYNGTRWLDFICGLGTCHFGYGNEKIVRKQLEHIYKGSCHSLPTGIEVQAAEKLREAYPWIQKVKWVNDGSSACTAACEMARIFTDREWILTEGYHGWHPEQINPVAWKTHTNDFRIEHLYDNANFKNVAAVMIEPIQLDNSPERIEWLKKLRQKCTDHGTLLIYDEVITGLRYPKFGVCNNYGIKPDLVLLGKAMANGEKIGCIAGRADVLDGKYFCSGTYHGHLLSLATVIACIDLAMHDHEFDLEKLNIDSLYFIEKLNAISKGIFSVKGWGCRAAFQGDYHLYHQEMAKCKILFGPSLFINFENAKHLPEVLDLSKTIIERIRDGKATLIGSKPTPAFSTKART